MKVLLWKLGSVLSVAVFLCGSVGSAYAGDCFYVASKASGYQDIYNALSPCRETLHTGAFVPGAGANYVGCADINVEYVDKYYSNYGYKSSADFTTALLADACLQQKVAAQVLKDACEANATVEQRICGYYTGQCSATCEQAKSVAVKNSVGYVGSVLSAKVANLWNKLLGTTKSLKKSVSAGAVTGEVDEDKVPQDTCAQLFDSANVTDFMTSFKKSMLSGHKVGAVASYNEIDKTRLDDSGNNITYVKDQYSIDGSGGLKPYVLGTIGQPSGTFTAGGSTPNITTNTWAVLWGGDPTASLDGSSCITTTFSKKMCEKLDSFVEYDLFGPSLTMSDTSIFSQCNDVETLKKLALPAMGEMCIPDTTLDEGLNKLLGGITALHKAGGSGDIGANGNPDYTYKYKK